MKTSDPIANLLSSFSNAARVNKYDVVLPFSSFKERLLETLKTEGVVQTFKRQTVEGREELLVTINPKYSVYKRISRPGRRLYLRATKLPRKYREIVIVSTPKGIMSVKNAIKSNVGGEVLLEVS